MLRFKPAVRIGHFNEPLALMLLEACTWSLLTGIDVEINSIRDSAPDRASRSLHPFDLAVDFDTVGDQATDLERLADYFRRVLPTPFDIVLEGDHVHVEWDARRGPLKKTVS